MMGKKKFVLHGSLEASDTEAGIIQGAVFEGEHEWDVNSTLRYLRISLDEFEAGETVGEVLFRVYDNSTGCLVKGTFKRTGQ